MNKMTRFPQDLVGMRILVRHGFSRDLANLLVDNLKRCKASLEKNPVMLRTTEKESGGYKHNGCSDSGWKNSMLLLYGAPSACWHQMGDRPYCRR